MTPYEEDEMKNARNAMEIETSRMSIAKLVPNKPDADLAIELKADLAEAAKPWMEACTRASKAGFQVQASFGPNPFGQYVIQVLNLSKVF